MTISTRERTETSAMFSLQELAELEAERVRDEERQRVRSREDRVREQRLDLERRRADEEARIAGEAEERARRLRAEAEERARIEARKQAELDVARIQAEGRARLESDNAQRAHELAVLRVRTDRSRQRLRHGLVALVALFVCGGAASAYGVSQRMSDMEVESLRLRADQRAAVEDHQHGMTAALAALDRRHETLLARPAQGSEEARNQAAKARRALDAALDDEGLVAFATALDGLEKRMDTVEKVRDLDRRHADLASWARSSKRADRLAKAERAAAAARAADPSDEALAAWASALDALSVLLGDGGPATAVAHGSHGTTTTTTTETRNTCTKEGDPACGLDGKIENFSSN